MIRNIWIATLVVCILNVVASVIAEKDFIGWVVASLGYFLLIINTGE